MRAATLHIVAAIANPIRWESRVRLARNAIADWLREPNVYVTIVEAAHGARSFALTDLGEHDRVTHIPVRAATLVWSKENLLNIGISRLPHHARYIGTFDADVHFRKPGWATETLHALQLYPVVQPWKTALDLGPNDELIQCHTSFASLYHAGEPVVATGTNFWTFDGGSYRYAHSGFAWAWSRETIDNIGGLFELGGMGSGDHHMALGLVGAAEKSMPSGTNGVYREAVKLWESRALIHVNRKLGFVPGIIEHKYHGRKSDRAYVSRWDMFVEHRFSPYTDLKRNSFGVLEFSGNKPELELCFDRYLRSRNEDTNSL